MFGSLFIFVELHAGNDKMWNQTILIYKFSPVLFEEDGVSSPVFAKFTSSTPDL